MADMKPDLVLLDLELPDAGGLELLKELRTMHPGLPVMILTAHDSLANAIESIKLGAFHFLPKPYAVEELVSLCHRALEQQALVRKRYRSRRRRHGWKFGCAKRRSNSSRSRSADECIKSSSS